MPRLIKTAESETETDRGRSAERSAFVERLHIILSHWPSADRLARAMGVSPSAFRKWLKGEAKPSRERLVALARAAGVGVAWLAEGQGPDPTFETAAGMWAGPGSREATGEAEWKRFTRFPNGGRASGSEARNGAAHPPGPGWLALHDEWIRTVCRVEPQDLSLEMATCESMTPTIRVGHTLLVDTTDRMFHNFGIYVLEIDGHRFVNRVQRWHDGSLVLINDNVAYLPDVIDHAKARDLKVIGRVLWAGGLV